MGDMPDFLGRHIKRPTDLFSMFIYLVLTLDLARARDFATLSGSHVLRARS
jgi:hypothetical protein